MSRIVTRLVAVVLVLAMGGWGVHYYMDQVRPPAEPPAAVVLRYFDALKNGRFEEAYGMVSARHYHESLNQFIDRVSMYSRDMTLEILGESMAEGRAEVSLRVSLPLRFGVYDADSRMDLVRAGPEWKIIHP